MANTYTQIYIQVVFAVLNRECLITRKFKEELQKYITGIVSNEGQKLLAIDGAEDHLHILIGMKPDIALSDLVRDVKASSSKHINQQRWVRGRFYWQEGFEAFSYSHSQLTSVINYIRNQENHHEKKSFKSEYLKLLERFQIPYESKYLFNFLSDD